MDTEQKTMIKKQDTLEILKGFDRLPNNPDTELVQKYIQQQLLESGIVTINMFACPTYNPASLLGDCSEEYVLTEVQTPDLFTPRVKKLKEIMQSCNSVKLNIIIGNTDPTSYVLPILAKYGVKVDMEKLKTRSQKYTENFAKRVKELSLENTSVLSLLDMNVPETKVTIPKEKIEDEVKFLEWLFLSETGPYKRVFPLTQKDLKEMAEKKFAEYGKQGKIIESLGGIMLQTETPWLLRTEMIKCGSANIGVIYPWIRKEEL